MDLKKHIYQSGMSLAEAMMAVVISTIVLGTAYFIYNNFQQTFVRQLNHSVSPVVPSSKPLSPFPITNGK